MPAPNVHVAFHGRSGIGNDLCPVGITDAAGVFRLRTGGVPEGAPEGDYWVSFAWPDPTVEIDECECPDPLVHDQLKCIYATQEAGYDVTIGQTANCFRFSLYRSRSEDVLLP